MLTRPPDWTVSAACNGLATRESDPWHPVSQPGRQVRAADWAEARWVCMRCPVQSECLRYATELLAVGSLQGMMAGLTPDELRTMVRRIGRSARKQARHGTRTAYVNLACRCAPCLAANARYEASRRRGRRDEATEGAGSCAAYVFGTSHRRPCGRPARQGTLYCPEHSDKRADEWTARATAAVLRQPRVASPEGDGSRPDRLLLRRQMPGVRVAL